MKKCMFLLSTIFVLVACGGEDEEEVTGKKGIPDSRNVALADNGGVATASYDSGNAGIVNDGNASGATFWAGNAPGDYVTIALDKEYDINHFMIWTNEYYDLELYVSTDGTNFSRFYLSGYNIDCASISGGMNRIDCGLSAPVAATHIRLVMTASSNVSSSQVYEIQAAAD